MKWLNGWKTILGVVLLVVLCVLNGGNVADCIRDALATPQGQAGIAVGLTAVGLLHKVEKVVGKGKP
jgi:hypothetical protein